MPITRCVVCVFLLYALGYINNLAIPAAYYTYLYLLPISPFLFSHTRCARVQVYNTGTATHTIITCCAWWRREKNSTGPSVASQRIVYTSRLFENHGTFTVFFFQTFLHVEHVFTSSTAIRKTCVTVTRNVILRQNTWMNDEPQWVVIGTYQVELRVENFNDQFIYFDQNRRYVTRVFAWKIAKQHRTRYL